MLPDAAGALAAVDVRADEAPEAVFAAIGAALDALLPAAGEGALLLADVPGATPCNVAQRILAEDGRRLRLLAGVSLPMLLRALSYRREPLDCMAERALEGGHIAMLSMSAIDD